MSLRLVKKNFPKKFSFKKTGLFSILEMKLKLYLVRGSVSTELQQENALVPLDTIQETNIGRSIY